MEKFLIAGLGNPGKKYTFTRHNIGFRLLDNWLINSNPEQSEQSSTIFQKKYLAKTIKFKRGSKTIIAAKPQTFMNKSGFSIKSLQQYYKINTNNILIIHDDLSFPIGKYKLSRNSGPAGHNGVKSIIEELGDKNFNRLRIGIASIKDNCPVNHQSGHNFVLGKFSPEEEKIIESLLPKTVELINYFIDYNFEETSNKFNGN